MGHRAIENVGTPHSAAKRRDARGHLRHHPAAELVFHYHLLGLVGGECRDECRWVVHVSVQTVDVGQEDHLVRLEGGGKLACDQIGVDVEAATVITSRHGGHDGDEVILYEVVDHGRVDRYH